MSDERPRRAYHSPLRQQRAAARREAVLEAAAECFSESGWNGTTMTAIAERAETSVETVYGVGAKAYLLLESFRRRYGGSGGWSSLLEQPDVQALMERTGYEECLDGTCDWLARAHRTSAELWMVIRAAAPTDAKVAEETGELHRLRRESFGATADWLARAGVVPTPSDDDDRRALSLDLAVLMSAETWVQLKQDWDFDDADYRAWMRRQLLSLRLPSAS